MKFGLDEVRTFIDDYVEKAKVDRPGLHCDAICVLVDKMKDELASAEEARLAYMDVYSNPDSDSKELYMAASLWVRHATKAICWRASLRKLEGQPL